MNIEVSRALPSDVADLTTILNGGTAIKLAHDDQIWGEKPFMPLQAQLLIARNEVYFASVDAKRAGCVALTTEDERMWGADGLDGQTLYIHKLSRLEDDQYKGVGSALMRWVTDEAKSRDKRYLRLDCPAENQLLCGYYANKGFHFMGRVVVPGRRPGSIDYDAATFERRIG